jgi:hypothetical protein
MSAMFERSFPWGCTLDIRREAGSASSAKGKQWQIMV